jgi:hypothetical protein
MSRTLLLSVSAIALVGSAAVGQTRTPIKGSSTRPSRYDEQFEKPGRAAQGLQDKEDAAAWGSNRKLVEQSRESAAFEGRASRSV